MYIRLYVYVERWKVGRNDFKMISYKYNVKGTEENLIVRFSYYI